MSLLRTMLRLAKFKFKHPCCSSLSAPPASDVGYVTAEQADEIIKTKATQQWDDISRAFRNFDEDGNGIVTKKELKNILYRYQLSLTQQEFDKLWNR